MCQSKKPYIVSVLLALGVGALSAFFSGSGREGYMPLERPPLSPPSFVFPVVWTILFILMGIGAAMIFCADNVDEQKKEEAITCYTAQLAVNFFWSIFFFRLEWRFFSFLWILLLIGLVICMIRRFYPISSRAARLQIPYLVWICFAAYLNFGIWWLNR